MLFWALAVVIGVGWAAASYLPALDVRRIALPAALRALAITLIVLLLANVAFGRARARPPFVALDVSRSWSRGTDSTAWNAARRELESLKPDTVLLVGDSVRIDRVPSSPADSRTLVRPLVERVLAAGRAVVLLTDGIVEDPDALDALPSGSSVKVYGGASRPDGALANLEAPRAIVAGDTVEAKITLVAGAGGAPAGRVTVFLDDSPWSSVNVEPLTAFAERAVVVRAQSPETQRKSVLRAVWQASGDAEARNDTLAVALEITPAAGVVFVSTSPDYDSRFALDVLRGALALSTHGYIRVAPGVWRVEGTFAAITEAEVRRAALEAPLVILHGDTSVFGAPRSAARGALALVSPARSRDAEWFVTGAPASPVAAALSGIAWDSLPPVDVADNVPNGEWTVIDVQRSRRFERKPLIVGWERPKRVVLVGGSGLWRWRFRGGQSADAFASLWGGIVDWLAAERPDVRAAIPADGVVRAGDALRWRRGGADSLVTVVMRARGTSRADSVSLRFAPGQSIAEGSPLAAGVYDVTTRGGSAVLVVNAPRELLPARPTVKAGRVGGGLAASSAPGARTFGLLFGLAIALLCGEWFLRRRAGLR